jgi:hypothetical protein
MSRTEVELPHSHLYTRLRPSGIHGIGVFAVRRIRKNMHLFSDDTIPMVWIDRKRLRKLPREIQRFYDDFAVLKKGKYGCPPSFNCLSMAWYLNEPRQGQSPNVRCDPETYEFYARRDIACGEELTVSYGEYSEEPANRCDASHALKSPRLVGLRSAKGHRGLGAVNCGDGQAD